MASETRARWSCTAIKEGGHLVSHPISCHFQCFINMDIALRYPSGRMAKQCRDCQLRKAKVAREARKGMTQRVRSDVQQSRVPTGSIKNTHHADEMALAPIGRKEERRRRLWLFEKQIKSTLSDHADLSAALGIREADCAFLFIKPDALQPQAFHASETCQKKEPNGREASRMLAVLCSRP